MFGTTLYSVCVWYVWHRCWCRSRAAPYVQRSYRKELFDDALSRMRRARIKTPLDVEAFETLQEKVDALVVEKLRTEVDYGEIPEEFKGQPVQNAAF